MSEGSCFRAESVVDLENEGADPMSHTDDKVLEAFAQQEKWVKGPDRMASGDEEKASFSHQSQAGW